MFYLLGLFFIVCYFWDVGFKINISVSCPSFLMSVATFIHLNQLEGVKKKFQLHIFILSCWNYYLYLFYIVFLISVLDMVGVFYISLIYSYLYFIDLGIAHLFWCSWVFNPFRILDELCTGLWLWYFIRIYNPVNILIKVSLYDYLKSVCCPFPWESLVATHSWYYFHVWFAWPALIFPFLNWEYFFVLPFNCLLLLAFVGDYYLVVFLFWPWDRILFSASSTICHIIGGFYCVFLYFIRVDYLFSSGDGLFYLEI